VAGVQPERTGAQGRSVRSGGTVVRVRTSPFGLAVVRRGAGAVLRTAPTTDPLPLGVELDPEAGGADSLPEVARYAPVTFEVGGSVSASFPAGPFVGNLITGAGAGLQFATTDVVDVQRRGGGLRVTVATDDPTGRRVLVDLRPDRSGTVAIGVRLSNPVGVSSVAMGFAAHPDEAFHGFGGRHNAVDQRGQELVQYNLAQNLSAGPLQPVPDVLPGTGGEQYLFPNGPTAAYYVQNSFISSRGYGFLLDREELSRFRLASDRERRWQVATSSAALDAVVTAAPPRGAIRALTSLTGRHRVPPRWATGSTLYRGVRVLSAESDDAESYEAKVRADLRRIDRYAADRDPRNDLLLSAYAIEGWAILPRPVLLDLIAELKERGLRVMLYLRSYAAIDVAGTENTEVFTTALRRGYFTRTAAGTPYLFGSTFVAGVAGLIDFTNPEAVRWWKGRVRAVLALGADGFMQDFGEQVLPDMVFADGRTGAQLHNRYPVLYHRATRQVFDRFERTHPRRGCCFMFTRTGFTGRPGSAAFESSNFPGDETTDFSVSSGLPSIVPDMLNRAVGGLYGFNTDIGGYLDTLTGTPTRELFTRWTQAAALTPFFRVHNSSSTGVRMPWSYDRATLRRYAEMSALHTAFEPYVRRLWQRAVRTGMPVVRPMWLSGASAPGARTDKTQWLLGQRVLVAPVLVDGARSREVSFPQGCWAREGDGKVFRGPARVRVSATLGQLPWFVRC
jgi:alpha-glucosidase (family GH31 glycosyl hydrolase)